MLIAMSILSPPSRRLAGPLDARVVSDRETARRDDHVTRLQRELEELLGRRDDLDGVSGMADLLRLAVRWSA